MAWPDDAARWENAFRGTWAAANAIKAERDKPDKLFCDYAEEMRARVESYDAGWNMVPGQTVVSIDALREWAAAMERAAEIIEGPAD